MPGAEARQERRRVVDLDVAARSGERSVVVDEERSVELGELLDGLAELRARDLQQLRRVAVERIQDQRPRARERLLDVADDEERADLPALAAFTRDLDAELHDLLEGP